MTNNKKKARSLILAALMVFSVFAGTVAFSGAATAANADTDADATLNTQNMDTYWQGQVLYHDAGSTADQTYEIRELESDGSVGGLAKQVTTDEDGDLLIETSDLDGKYVLEAPDNSEVARFEIAKQTMSADFASDSVENDASGTLEIDSNRGSFPLTISAERDGNSVSEDKLASMISGASAGDNDDGEVTLADGAHSEISVNFNEMKTGNYTFTVGASDTTATDTASINVTDAAASDVTFTQSTFEVAQGDVAEITIEFTGDANTATVVVGEKSESGYQAAIEATDNDDDDQVTIQFNTYTAGNGESGVTVDAAGEDTATLASSDETNLPDSPNDILEQGDYGLAVALGHDTSGTTSGDAVLASPDDVGTLYINERSTDSASVWTAPGSVSSGDLEGTSFTEDTSIATGDWAVVQFSASGLGGAVEAGESLNIQVKQTDESTPQNTKAKTIDSSHVQIWSDTANDTYYAAIDTDAANVEAGEEYNATLTVDDQRLAGEDGEVVGATFELVEGAVSIDEPVNVTASEDQQITGTSTYAPGTEFQVQIESTGDTQPRFFESATAVVQADGSWNVTFDRFAQQSAGDTFTVNAMNGAAEADGNVVEQTETPTTTNTTTSPTTTTETPTDGTPTASPTDGGTPTPSDEPTDTNTPGFGVAVALVALLAAALLAVRRD